MLCQAFELGKKQIVVCAISPDCQTIASTDFCHHNTTPHRLLFWDISQGSFSLLYELENTYGQVTKIDFSAGSKTVATGNFQGKIALQEVNTARLIKTLDTGSCVNDIAFSLDGKYMLSCCDYAGAHLWSLKSGEQLDHFSGFQGWTYGVAFSRDGFFAAAGDDYGCIQIWQLSDGVLLNTLNHIFNHLSCFLGLLAFSCDGDIIASVNQLDGTIKFWWWRQAHKLMPLCLQYSNTGISAIAFHPHRPIFAWADGCNVKLWDFEHDAEFDYQHVGQINIIQFSLDGRKLYICHTIGFVIVWQL